jgi:hypothetical protein
MIRQDDINIFGFEKESTALNLSVQISPIGLTKDSENFNGGGVVIRSSEDVTRPRNPIPSRSQRPGRRSVLWPPLVSLRVISHRSWCLPNEDFL